MRKNARRLGWRGRSHCTSRRTGGHGIPLAERLRRMLERRVGEATRRGGRDLSDKDLSAAVVDISRLVTASARLKKLDAPEGETGPKSLDSLEEHIMSIMCAEETAARRGGERGAGGRLPHTTGGYGVRAGGPRAVDARAGDGQAGEAQAGAATPSASSV